jgi:hypothetical protein
MRTSGHYGTGRLMPFLENCLRYVKWQPPMHEKTLSEGRRQLRATHRALRVIAFRLYRSFFTKHLHRAIESLQNL